MIIYHFADPFSIVAAVYFLVLVILTLVLVVPSPSRTLLSSWFDFDSFFNSICSRPSQVFIPV